MNEDRLKKMQERIPVNNYAQVFLLQSVICQSCNAAVIAQDIIVCRSNEELIARAEKEHRLKQTIRYPQNCITPQLLIGYGTALLDKNILPPEHETNGSEQLN